MRNLTLFLVLGLVSLGCARSELRREPLVSLEGQVSLLTFNVAGLPDFLTDQDHPKERMYGIAHYANKYDVVAYQEDFNYQRHLDRHSRFENRVRGSKTNGWSLLWTWLRRSGLTIQAPWALKEDFNAFSTCYGHTGHGSDCWVPKGVLCSRTTVGGNVGRNSGATVGSGGVVMDVCTVHIDAGSSKRDWEVKGIQVEEYLSFLPEPVTDAPYILVEMGDYNMRPRHELMQSLMAGKDFVISERYGQDNFVEVNEVDYIMVTSNELVNVTLIEGGTAKEFNGWSDHLAVFATLGLEIEDEVRIRHSRSARHSP